MKNYSRQREAILNVLRSTDTHPTADWIYNEVRKSIPNISLGTVYRNLAALSEAGEILRLNVGEGREHFDGNISPHLHLTCKVCGSITDAFFNDDPFAGECKSNGFSPVSPVYVVYGVCKSCSEKAVTPHKAV